MKTINDGGPAFPAQPIYKLDGAIISLNQGGMTLRTYLAGQALAGQLAFSPSDPFKKYHQPEEVANACFRFADAMLAAQEEKL